MGLVCLPAHTPGQNRQVSGSAWTLRLGVPICHSKKPTNSRSATAKFNKKIARMFELRMVCLIGRWTLPEQSFNKKERANHLRFESRQVGSASEPAPGGGRWSRNPIQDVDFRVGFLLFLAIFHRGRPRSGHTGAHSPAGRHCFHLLAWIFQLDFFILHE